MQTEQLTSLVEYCEIYRNYARECKHASGNGTYWKSPIALSQFFDDPRINEANLTCTDFYEMDKIFFPDYSLDAGSFWINRSQFLFIDDDFKLLKSLRKGDSLDIPHIFDKNVEYPEDLYVSVKRIGVFTIICEVRTIYD